MWVFGSMISLFFMSCSSRLQGFQYVNRNQGPDMTLNDAYIARQKLSTEPASEPSFINAVPTAPEENAIAGFAAPAAETFQENQASAQEKDEIRQAVERVGDEMTQTYTVRLTEKQAQKATKLVKSWMGKKQDPSTVDWTPRTNMEMFSVGAAGVGLVVAFFSPIGWFVFMVAALTFLYLKLLKK